MGVATHEKILGEKYDPKWAAADVVIGTLLLTLAVSFAGNILIPATRTSNAHGNGERTPPSGVD